MRCFEGGLVSKERMGGAVTDRLQSCIDRGFLSSIDSFSTGLADGFTPLLGVMVVSSVASL